MDGAFSPFFQSHYRQRLDTPHKNSHGDPWGSEEAYPHVFRWKGYLRRGIQFLPVVGMGSFYPHLFLAFAADYFFRSLVLVWLGVVLWSIFVELPTFFVLDHFDLIPRDKSMWKTFVVYDKKKPSRDEIENAMGFKAKYEKPAQGEFYGVFAIRKAAIGRGVIHGMREDMAQEAGDGIVTRVIGITYHKRDFASYVLTALILDILIGFLGSFVSWYLHSSFLLNSFRPSIDGTLVGQFIILYIIVSHLVEYWGWIFGTVVFGYIFAMGGWNSDVRESWTPYLAFFGVTLYYWAVFFRNPIPLWIRSPWLSPEMNPNGPIAVREITAGDTGIHEHHISPEAREPSVRNRRPGNKERDPATTSLLIETAAAHATADYTWSWWIYSAMNYETYGYNAVLGSLFLLGIIAVVGLAID